MYLNTRQPYKRFKILRSRKEIDELPDNCTNVFETNIHDYYQHRPYNLNNLSLYRFCSWYEKHLWVNLNENVWKGYTSLNLIFG